MSEQRAARREYLLTLGLLAVGGVLGLLARSQTWGSADVTSSFSVTSITATGGDLAPLVSGVPFVALAAVVLVPAVRTVGRRIAGGVLALLGATTMLNVLLVSTELTDQVYRWIIRTPEVGGQVGTVSTAPSWPVVAVAAALCIVSAGLLVLLHGPRWPGMGARYERPAGDAPAGPGATPGAAAGAGPDAPGEQNRPNAAQAWDALDRGDDPTT